MLIKLCISGFALIDTLEFEPEEGLNVISGETGAGKSLLIDAIGALIGNRIGKECVRSGNEKAMVEGVFDHVSDVISVPELIDLGISADDDDLLYITREIYAAGKSIIRINGKLVPLFVLKSIGPRLLDIHGQNDQQTIFTVSKHIELLDRFAGEKMSRAISEYTIILDKYRVCLDEIKRLGIDPQSRQRRVELLQYQVEELERAGFKVGEEEELHEKKKLSDAIGKISVLEQYLADAFSSDDNSSPLSLIRESDNRMNQLASLTDAYRPISDRMKAVILDLEAVGEDFNRIQKRVKSEEMSPDDIDDRLDLLYRLKSKYGAGIPEMIKYEKDAREELNILASSEERLREMHTNRISLEKDLLSKAIAIRSVRGEAAERLSDEIVSELSDLGMPGSSFGVVISERPKNRFFSKNGCDEASFVFSANPGEPEKPLDKIVSGGEASRIMLAVKTILAHADSTPSLIFDEIDAGVSGKTATAVSSKMKRLARYKQVLCVTHLAQIAAAADVNYFITKELLSGRTQTVLHKLDQEGQKREVARLLSGETDVQSLNLSEHMISAKENE